MWLMCSLWQTHPTQQVAVARVGAHSVPEWVNSEKDYVGGMLVVSLFEQTERLVLLAESGVNRSKRIRLDISVRRQLAEFQRNLQRVSPPTRDGINPTPAARNELVLCCYSLVLIGNLVVFGKGLRIHALHCIRPSQRGTNYCSVRIQVESLLELSNRLIVSSRGQVNQPQSGNYFR